MQLGEKMTTAELNIVLNGWQPGTVGHEQEERVIEQLDTIGAAIGYGALSQLAQWLYETQCRGNPKHAAAMKRERFKMLGWSLPVGFEETAAK